MNFDEKIKNGVVVVDFFATWCGPCKMLSPIIDEVEHEMSDIEFLKIDVDKEEELARKFGVMSIPTVIIFKDGEIKSQNVGFMSKDEIIEMINTAK
ncbi:MAG: thioredoxin [Bacilli bacterium]|nr:thioredoxin [Bacilli bacterium]